MQIYSHFLKSYTTNVANSRKIVRCCCCFSSFNQRGRFSLIKNYWCPVKKENIFILIFMLRFENSLLRKQNGITSQIVYYHFEDRVLHFLGVSHIN